MLSNLPTEVDVVTRAGSLVLGIVMVSLGLAPIVTGGPAERMRYILIAAGCAGGAMANALFRHRRRASVSWKNLANGAWLGAIVLPVVTVMILGGGASTVGEYLGFSVALGLLIGYGLGMVARAVTLRGDPASP